MPARDTDLPPDLRALEPGYELIRELGRGGMAAVYLARDRARDRLVAIKAIRASYVNDDEALHRFAREARTVADLDHRNIVRTYEVKWIGDRALAIVMQHVAGGTVRDWLRERGAFSAEHAESVLRDIAQALRYAHRRGIVHRDVKPENIFLEEGTGRALLSDFGIARPINGDSDLTMLGGALGTPQYMSPEQVDGRPVDGRSDIYSLGVLGWELLTGLRPWAGENLYSIIYKQKHEDLPRMTTVRPRVPANLLFAIEGAMVKDRDRRWQTIDEFLRQLTYNPPPVLAQPYPASSVPPPDEPTVRFRRASAELAPSAPKREDPTAIAEAAAPAPLVAQPFDVSYGSTPLRPVPGDDDDTSELVPSVRMRAARALALIVPLSIAAVSLFVVLGGRAEADRDDTRRPEIASGGTIALRESAAADADSAEPPRRIPVSPPPADTRTVKSAGPRRASNGAATRPRATSPSRAQSNRSVDARDPAPAPPVRRDTAVAIARADSIAPPPVLAPVMGADSISNPTPGSSPAQRTSPVATSSPRVEPARPSGSAAGWPSGPGNVPSPRCHLAASADQRACLLAYIDRTDVQLNSVYQSLIGELERVAGAGAGEPEPPSVRRLRIEQRAWLSVRDAECRRQGAGTEGPFWARERAPCFAEMSAARTRELREAVDRLRRRR